MAGPEVCPLAEIGLAENHGAGRAQLLSDKRIAGGDGAGKGKRSGGGHHAIGSIDVVFDEYGNAVQRAARAFLMALLVESIGDRQRVGIQLDNGVDGRTALVDFVDPLQILSRRWTVRCISPDFMPACKSVTVASSSSKGFTDTGDGEADSD